MKNKIRIIFWTIVTALVLALPVLMLFSEEVNLGETIAYAVILLALGGFFELLLWLKTRIGKYRIAFGLGLFGILTLFWANGAVGIIGNESNPANLLYVAVLAVSLVGSVISRLKPLGMSRTMFTAAAVQILVPVFALTVWPANASWGGAGVTGVFIINFVFAAIFAAAGMFFRWTHDEIQ